MSQEVVISDKVSEEIRDYISEINQHLNVLRSLSEAITKRLKADYFENEFFVAEVKYLPLGDKLVNAVFRIEPKYKVNEDLLQLIYLSDIFLKDEPSIIRAVSSGTWKKLGKGSTISFSVVVYEDLKDIEIRRIIRRFQRVFMAFKNDELRKKLASERKKLESLANNPKKKAKEIILTVMRINDLLFYESTE